MISIQSKISVRTLRKPGQFRQGRFHSTAQIYEISLTRTLTNSRRGSNHAMVSLSHVNDTWILNIPADVILVWHARELYFEYTKPQPYHYIRTTTLPLGWVPVVQILFAINIVQYSCTNVFQWRIPQVSQTKRWCTSRTHQHEYSTIPGSVRNGVDHSGRLYEWRSALSQFLELWRSVLTIPGMVRRRVRADRSYYTY